MLDPKTKRRVRKKPRSDKPTRAGAGRVPAPRHQTTMRIHDDVVALLSKEARKLNVTRTFLTEQVLVRWLISRGHDLVDVVAPL